MNHLRILALDCATVTGWAAADVTIESGVERFPVRRGEAPGDRLRRFRLWVCDLIEEHAPELVVYEAPGRYRSGAAASLATALTSRVEEEAARAGVRCVSVSPTALKKHATGSGTAGKVQMIVAAHRRFHGDNVFIDTEMDDNEADALCLLAWALDGCPAAERRAHQRKERV